MSQAIDKGDYKTRMLKATHGQRLLESAKAGEKAKTPKCHIIKANAAFYHCQTQATDLVFKVKLQGFQVDTRIGGDLDDFGCPQLCLRCLNFGLGPNTKAQPVFTPLVWRRQQMLPYVAAVDAQICNLSGL